MAKTRLSLILNIFIILFIFINSQESYKRVLNYYHTDNRIYSIEENEVNFRMLIKENVDCVMEPCILPILEEQTIENKDLCFLLRYLFDKIFENFDTDTKEITVKYQDLTLELKLIILNFLEKMNIFSTLEYEILPQNINNKKYIKRGYTYELENESVIYTIAMGQMPSSGYSIEIEKVKIKKDNALIYVSEKVPGINEGVDTVLTYPIAQVKFNHLPSSVEVINYDTGEEYKFLN